MSVDVTTEVVIARPRAEVAAFACDPGNVPAWYANIRSVAWRTPPPAQVGSQVDLVARFLGRTLAYTYEVVELEPGSRMVMRTAQGPFPMETTYAFDDAPGGTRVRLTNRGEPTGFARVTAPVLAAAVRRANEKDLQRLRRVLLSRPCPLLTLPRRACCRAPGRAGPPPAPPPAARGRS